MGRLVVLSGQSDGARSVDYPRSVTWQRRDLVEASDTTTLTYAPPIGQGGWRTSTLDRGSCVSGGTSTIEPGNTVTFAFQGTSVSVNIVKSSNGAPYSVSLDGNIQAFDSFATSQQCSTDFKADNLTATSHTIIVTHQGNSTLLGLGRSTLFLASIEYTPSNHNSNPTTPVGAIVGGVVGVVILILFGAFFYWWFRRRKLRQHEDARIVDEYKDEPQNQPHGVPPVGVDPFVTPVFDSNHPRNVNEFNAPLQANATTTSAQPARRTKADYFNEQSGRYGGNNSPWASLSAHGRSNPNSSNPQLQQLSSTYSGMSESPPPTTIALHQYPPRSATENSSEPGSSEPRQVYQIPRNPLQTLQHPQSGYVPAPSEAGGESIAIDRSDYIPPPSYSPPSAHSMPAPSLDAKATYTTSNTNTFSPWHSQSSHQGLSAADVDVIAKRVYDLMRSGSSTGGSSAGGGSGDPNRPRDDRLSAMSESVYSGLQSELGTSDADQAQIQQAVRLLLERDRTNSTAPASGKQGP